MGMAIMLDFLNASLVCDRSRTESSGVGSLRFVAYLGAIPPLLAPSGLKDFFFASLALMKVCDSFRPVKIC